MKRVITDEPKSMDELLMNFAYAKYDEIYVRQFEGKKNVNINDIVREVSERADYSAIIKDVPDGEIFDILMNDDGYASVMIILATQAAELRGLLREYENRGLVPPAIKDLQMKVVDLELKLQGHDRELFDQRESVIDEIVDYLKECGFTEASMAVEEYREL